MYVSEGVSECVQMMMMMMTSALLIDVLIGPFGLSSFRLAASVVVLQFVFLHFRPAVLLRLCLLLPCIVAILRQ